MAEKDNIPTGDMIKEVEEAHETITDAVNSANEKEGVPPEITKHELALFDHISKTTVGILHDDSVIEIFKTLNEKIGQNVSEEMVRLISTTVTYATYHAIAYYDQGIKARMEEYFRAAGDVVMRQGSDIQVLQLKVGDLIKRNTVKEAQAEIDLKS